MKVKLTAAAALVAALAFSQTPAVVVSPVPQLQFFDNNGKPLSGGQVCTYAAGTTTPLTTYTSSTGTVANPNPVILDASGRANIWIAAPAIKYVLRAKGNPQNCSNGTTLYTVDGVQDQALKLRTDITGPNGLAMLTYTPPPTATVPNPGGGPIPMNQRAAQIINVQDYDTPPFQTCGVAAHDDAVAAQKAENYAAKNGGGTVMFPRGGQCWFNSISAQVNAVNVTGSNLILDGNGSTINSTINAGGITMPSGFVVFGGNPSGKGWQDTSRTKYSFTHAGIGDLTFTVCAGCGVNFHVGDAIYTQSGAVIAGTPFNAEGNVVNAVNGDVLNLRYPIEHQFAYSAAPDGVTVVTADTRFDNTWRNFRTAPQFQGVFVVAVQCVHCSFLDIDADFTGQGLLIVDGMSRDLLFDHANVTETNPNVNNSPLFQFASGMSDTIIRHSNFACNGTTNNAASVSLNPSEGASNSIFESGTISGNCPIGASTYQGFTLKDSLITINNPIGAEISFAGSGTATSTRLRVTGNTMEFAATASKTNVFVAGDQSQFTGNRIISASPSGTGAIIATQSCAQCMVSDNILVTSGYGFVFQGIPQHSFNVVNNNVTCTAGSTFSGFYIQDDGQQTVGETVQGNTANGCATGLTVVNPAHEIGSFTPNSFAGTTTPYSNPALTAQTVSALNIVTPNGVSRLAFGTPSTPLQAYLTTDGSGNLQLVLGSTVFGIFQSGLIHWAPATQIDGQLTLSGASFKLNGKTCVISGTSISCT